MQRILVTVDFGGKNKKRYVFHDIKIADRFTYDILKTYPHAKVTITFR
jgi:hypothetical protein